MEEKSIYSLSRELRMQQNYFVTGDKLKIIDKGLHIPIKNISRNAEVKVGTLHK